MTYCIFMYSIYIYSTHNNARFVILDIDMLQFFPWLEMQFLHVPGSLWSCAASIGCCLQPSQEVRRDHVGLLLCSKSEKSATEMDFGRELNFAEQCLCLRCLPCLFLFCQDPFQTHSANLASRPLPSRLRFTLMDHGEDGEAVSSTQDKQHNLCISAHYVSILYNYIYTYIIHIYNIYI